MRSALIVLLSALPVLADVEKPPRAPRRAPVTARLDSVSVLFGPGIIPDRSGETPAPAFKPNLSGEIQVGGLAPGVHPRLRFWLVKEGLDEQLRRVSPRSAAGKELAHRTTGKAENGTILFSIGWTKGTVETQDRLFVEVFQGRRRVATAMSAIQSRYLPASRPRGDEEKN